MIPITKLRKLPQKTRVRKIIASLKSFEIEIRVSGNVDETYLEGMIAILWDDKKLQPLLSDLLGRKVKEFENFFSNLDIESKIRLLNNIRYRLQNYIGVDSAEWDFIDIETGKLDYTQRTVYPVRVFLEDIRSPYNVGSIFRTAEAFGVEKILLSSDTPLPTHKRALKTARGTSEIVKWEIASLTEIAVSDTNIFALETGGMSIEEFEFPQSGIVLIGSEELGLSPDALKLAKDSCGIVTIPMCGVKGSLNVSVAFGILMFLWYEQLQRSSSG